VAAVLLPEVCPVAIGVEFRTKRICDHELVDCCPIITLAIIRILELLADGVMEADKPVMPVKDLLLDDHVSVL
jgi:hypothetical protein